MSRAEELENIKADICDKYCKWPNEYLKSYEDPDVAHDKMIEEWCPECPLQRLELI